jgi:hypothetical protein
MGMSGQEAARHGASQEERPVFAVWQVTRKSENGQPADNGVVIGQSADVWMQGI